MSSPARPDRANDGGVRRITPRAGESGPSMGSEAIPYTREEIPRWSRLRRRRFVRRFLPTAIGSLVATGTSAAYLVRESEAAATLPNVDDTLTLDLPLDPRPAGAALSGAVTAPIIAGPEDEAAAREAVPIRWRRSVAVGSPAGGRLVRGVELPVEGADYVIDDGHGRRRRTRYGTEFLVRTILRVAATYRKRHPDAPRLVLGDLSGPEGGQLGGHASHQNGLDVDIYYPRRDRVEAPITSVDEIDMHLAQDLVRLFVRAGAEYTFVGPNTSLTGPPTIVVPLTGHDDHVHVRMRPH